MIPKGSTIVHVNRGRIDSNRKHARVEPVIAIKAGKSAKGLYTNEAVVYDLDGREVARFVYDPAGILHCGAKVVMVAAPGCRVEPAKGERLVPAPE